MATLVEVMLVVTIITGADKPNVEHREPMPDVKVCMEEAERFLEADFPEFVGAVGVAARCVGRIASPT